MSTTADHKFTFTVGVCFTLNYIIGTGFLTLPWAFHQAGYLLGFALLGIMTVFALLAVLFILEAMARTEELANKEATPLLNKKVSAFHGYNSIAQEELTQTTTSSHSTNDDIPQAAGLAVGSVKYQTPEMCEIYLGSWGRVLYTCLISIYLYTTLWVYSTVFAQTFAAHADLGPHSYAIYIVLFGFIVIPISLMKLSEQIAMQVVLSVGRIVMVVLMLGTILYAQRQDYASFGNYHPPAHASSDLFNPSKAYLMLPIAAYANIFHQAIPDLSYPVADKRQLLHIFSASLIISVFAYAALGVVIASYFGEKTNVASNLNWIRYHGKLLDDGSTPRYAQLISYFVVLFPAFDVASAFPLNAITLGNSLLNSIYGHTELNRQQRGYFRLLAAVPPVIAAYFVSNLGIVTDFAGVTGFATAFLFPGLLGYFSKRHLQERGMQTDTIYSVPSIGKGAQWMTAGLGVGLIVFVLGSLLLEVLNPTAN